MSKPNLILPNRPQPVTTNYNVTVTGDQLIVTASVDGAISSSLTMDAEAAEKIGNGLIMVVQQIKASKLVAAGDNGAPLDPFRGPMP